MNARDIAAAALTAFRKRDAWSDGYLRNAIRAAGLAPRDAALATAITGGVFRNMLLIDYYISCYSSVRLTKISPGILDLLRVAVFQILFLDRVPDSAAVNSAVGSAKRDNPRAAAFANALLRKISVSKGALPEIRGSLPERLSVQYSHPIWLVNMLIKLYGESTAEQLLASNNTPPQNFARVNTLKTTEEELTAKLLTEGVIVSPCNVENCIAVSGTGNIESLDSYRDGFFGMQDASSQLAAHSLGVLPGSRVLDACAAPGGKSFLLAQEMENTGELVACDIYDHKKKLIEDGARRLGIDIITARISDAAVFNSDYENAFDFVLADVPCSGLGIIRRKPDIRYKEPESLRALPPLQLGILKNVARYLKRGGTLVYSTCTILPRENERVIKSFLSENSEFEPLSVELPTAHIKNEVGVTLLPSLGNTDGFYICKLRRSL